jgi:hypothetical protein
MTLWAERSGQAVAIHGNIGLAVQISNSSVTGYTISGDAAHVRHFWGQLGKLLDEAENEQRESVTP